MLLLLRSSAATTGPAPLPHLGLLGGLGGLPPLTATQGIYTLAVQSANLLTKYTLTAAQGTYLVFGKVASLVGTTVLEHSGDPAPFPHLGLLLPPNTKVLTANTGLYSIVGSDGLADFEVTAATSTYTFTDQDAGVISARTLTAAQGTYSVTEQVANFVSSGSALVMTASQGSYSITEQSSNLLYGYLTPAGQGFYAVQAPDTGLIVGSSPVLTVPSILSSEQFGALIVGPTQPLTVTSISSSEAFGTTTFSFIATINMDSILTTESFGALVFGRTPLETRGKYGRTLGMRRLGFGL